jgi:hypothetical protein
MSTAPHTARSLGGSSSRGLSIGPIVAIAISGFIFLCICAGFAYGQWRQRKAPRSRDNRPVPVGNVRPLYEPDNHTGEYYRPVREAENHSYTVRPAHDPQSQGDIGEYNRPEEGREHDIDLPRYEAKSTPEYRRGETVGEV